MFENNPRKLPESNLIYLKRLLAEKQVKLSVVEVPYDLAMFDLSDGQVFEDYSVAEINRDIEGWRGEEPVVPRNLRMDSYTHYAVIMTAREVTRRINVAVLKIYRSEDLSFKVSSCAFIENLDDESSNIYRLACLVYVACYFWDTFRKIGFNAWMEQFKMRFQENEVYCMNSLNNNWDICQSLLDIFGQEATEGLITEFIPKCSSCTKSGE